MATVDPTQTTTLRTPPATWLAGLELPGVPPDTDALSRAVQKYLDSMDATLEVLSENEVEPNVVEQLSLGAYHKTVEMREFFEAWRAAAPENADELKQQAKQAFFKSQPIPQALYITKPFEAALDGDLSKAAMALELISRNPAREPEPFPQPGAESAFEAVEASFVEVAAIFSSLATWQRLAEQDPSAERSQALATTVDQLATRGTEILADIQGRLEAIQVFPSQAIMDASVAASLAGTSTENADDDEGFAPAVFTPGADYLPLAEMPDGLEKRFFDLMERLFPKRLADEFSAVFCTALQRDFSGLSGAIGLIEKRTNVTVSTS